MSAPAIEQYGRMVSSMDEKPVEFMVWMGEMIRYCEAQDARLE